MAKAVLTGPFPTLEAYQQSLELGRFCLVDECPSNSETFFLARAFRLAAQVGVRGIVSFSDPFARTDLDGNLIFPGHIGHIYICANSLYLGRSSSRRIILLPDGSVLSHRAIQKVRQRERGHEYVERNLIRFGARAPRAGQSPSEWIIQALEDIGARKLDHPGNHRYAFRVGTPAQRRSTPIGMTEEPYPQRSPDDGLVVPTLGLR